MGIVDRINCATGEHAGDWDVMDATVKLAMAKGVLVGAHASFPGATGLSCRLAAGVGLMISHSDRLFFARSPGFRSAQNDYASSIVSQLSGCPGWCLARHLPAQRPRISQPLVRSRPLPSSPGFTASLTFEHSPASRKPHGQAYLMSADDIELARASASCAELFNVPMVGLPGSAHEQAATEAGVAFLPEWYIDLQYADDGSLAPPDRQNYKPAGEKEVVARITRLLTTREYTTLSGKTLHWPASTVSICVHGDLPGAIGLATSVRKAIDALQ